MTTAIRRSSLRPLALLVAGALLGLSAQAAAPADKTDKGCTPHEARYDPAACKRETGAAKQEAQRNGLATPSAEAAGRNAADRCRALTGGERTDCLTRASGEGTKSTTTTSSGSVEGGGVIRETTTTTTTVPARP